MFVLAQLFCSLCCRETLKWSWPSQELRYSFTSRGPVTLQDHTWHVLTSLLVLHVVLFQWYFTKAWFRGGRHEEYLWDQQVPCGTRTRTGWPSQERRCTALHLLLRGKWLHPLYPRKDAAWYAAQKNKLSDLMFWVFTAVSQSSNISLPHFLLNYFRLWDLLRCRQPRLNDPGYPEQWC